MINHISICFLLQYQRQRKRFLKSFAEKGIARHVDASCVDSYQQWQISQNRLAAIVVKFNIPTIIRLRLVNMVEYSPHLGEYSLLLKTGSLYNAIQGI